MRKFNSSPAAQVGWLGTWLAAGAAPDCTGMCPAMAAKSEAVEATPHSFVMIAPAPVDRHPTCPPGLQLAAEQEAAAARQRASLWLDQYASLDALNERED